MTKVINQFPDQPTANYPTSLAMQFDIKHYLPRSTNIYR